MRICLKNFSRTLAQCFGSFYICALFEKRSSLIYDFGFTNYDFFDPKREQILAYFESKKS